ncbi:hypothetical protein C2S52_005436 [Perilla frutescens var. hirtella]|nr:hypothetical protein C2S52_005436 [Perilla frutescens var. hirtella]
MNKRIRIEADFGGVHLPEEMILLIQSFLTKKEAARTSFISKSWSGAWSSRPNVEFDQSKFRFRGVCVGKVFREFVEKAIQRYQDRNLKILSFRIFAHNFSDGMELILKAMKMGTVDINFETRPSKDRENDEKALPLEVLESKDLVRLSVTGCKIDGRVNWSSLESLSLFKVRIETDLISDLLSSSPLIEKLVLSDCKFCVTFPSPNLVAPSTSLVTLNNSLIDLSVFRNLKFLFLEKVNVKSSFFSDFSSKFPCLKCLDVRHCFFFMQKIQIDSHSLENIHFEHLFVLRAAFDVPSIRKFSFVGTIVPSLSFKTSSGEWESDITITWKAFHTSWFLRLNEFLGDLSPSMITLSLVLGKIKNVGESFRWPRDVGLPKPVVESLKIGVGSSMSSAVMDALFWSFHPKSISQLRMLMPDTTIKESNDFQELLCMTLIQGVNEDGCIPNRNTRAQHQLVGVNVEVFEDSLGEFRPLPLKLIMTDASVFSQREIRFKLQWEIGASTIH